MLSPTWISALVSSAVTSVGFSIVFFVLRRQFDLQDQHKKDLEERIKALENILQDYKQQRNNRRKEDFLRRQSYDSTASDNDEFFDVENEVLSEPEDLEPNYQEVDRLVEGDSTEIKNALDVLMKYEQTHVSNFKFLCYLAKVAVINVPLYSSVGPELPKKKMLIQMATGAGQRALSLNPESPDAHKWYAAAVGSKSEFLGFTEKLPNGQEFKRHVDRALELDPEDYFANFLKGRLLFEISGLTWFERKMASKFLSPIPTDCRAVALTHFIQTENTCPKPWKENYYYLMQCYLSNGDRSNASRCAQIGSRIAASSAEDRRLDPEFVRVLAQLQGSM